MPRPGAACRRSRRSLHRAPAAVDGRSMATRDGGLRPGETTVRWGPKKQGQLPRLLMVGCTTGQVSRRALPTFMTDRHSAKSVMIASSACVPRPRNPTALGDGRTAFGRRSGDVPRRPTERGDGRPAFGHRRATVDLGEKGLAASERVAARSRAQEDLGHDRLVEARPSAQVREQRRVKTRRAHAFGESVESGMFFLFVKLGPEFTGSGSSAAAPP